MVQVITGKYEQKYGEGATTDSDGNDLTDIQKNTYVMLDSDSTRKELTVIKKDPSKVSTGLLVSSRDYGYNTISVNTEQGDVQNQYVYNTTYYDEEGKVLYTQKFDGFITAEYHYKQDNKGNKILDYSPINKPKQNKLSNADEYNQQITLNLSNTGITDLTSINGIEVDSLDLSKNSISNLQNFQISDYTKNINLSENNIESLDGFIIPEGLIYLNVSKNKLKDISNFDSKNINSIDLSNNKEIKGFGSLKVQELMVNDCNISDLQELSKLSNVKYLAINNNSLEDISGLSNIKSLESININNNSKPLSGKLISENITSINIVDTEISDKLELDCSKLSSVMTTDIKFNTDYLKSSYSSIIYYNTELNEELINQNNEDKGIYKTYYNAKFPTVKADIKNNEVILEDTYMNTYKNLNNYIESDKIAISKDRKKLILLDNSINKLDIDYNKTSNEKYFLGKLTIEFTKISSLIDSIRNIFFK